MFMWNEGVSDFEVFDLYLKGLIYIRTYEYLSCKSLAERRIIYFRATEWFGVYGEASFSALHRMNSCRARSVWTQFIDFIFI